MDKDRIKGKGEQVKGAVKEQWGKATGSKPTEMKGKAEKAGGKAQESYGKGKEHAKAAADKHKR